MKIKNVTLRNFRSHADTTIDFGDRLTVIRGANHVGKSSIPYALEYIFAGRCPGTTSDGKGAGALVHEGSKQAVIRVEEQINVAECAIKANGSRNGDAASQDHRDILSCLTNTSFLYTMPAADQKNLLSKLVLPSDHVFPAWVQEHLNAVGLEDSLKGDLVRVIDGVYKSAYEERTVINRTLKAFVIPSGDTSAAKTPEQVTELEKKLAGLRNDLTTLSANQQAAGAGRREHQAKTDAAEQRLNRAQSALSREEQELPAIKGRLLNKKKLEEAQAIVKNKTKLEEIACALAIHERKAADAKIRRDELKKAKTGICDKCQQAISEETIAHMFGVAAQEYDLHTGSATGLRDELRTLGDPTMAQQTIDAHESAQRDEKRVNQRIAEARTEVDAARKAFEELPAPPAAGEDFSSPIEDLRQRISRGEGVVANVKAATSLIERQEKAAEEKKQLDAKLKMVERLVEEFGPKGMKAKLLDENIGGFQESMNAALGPWGYTCQLSFEPFSFGIVTRDKGHRELSHLSESEQHRFAIAFQVALAQWSNYNFVAVDRADVLDQASRKALLKMLWDSPLEQALVVGTDEREEAKAMDGVAVYRFILGEERTTVVERLA